MISLAESRKDCVAFASPERADVVNITNSNTQMQNVRLFRYIASSSYIVLIVVTNICTTDILMSSDMYH